MQQSSAVTTARPLATTPTTASHRRARSVVVFLVVGLAALLLLGLVSLTVGAGHYPLSDAVNAVFGNGDAAGAVVVLTQRIPRALIGIVCGLALGASGALMQGHTRNALADPGLFGVDAGAAFAVVVTTFALHVHDTPTRVVVALVGALTATAVVFRSAGGGRAAAAVSLALAGVAITAMLGALTTVIVLLDRQSLSVMRFWQVGSLAGRDLGVLTYAGPVMGAGLLLAIVNGHGLNALALGDDVASALGKSVRSIRMTGVLAIALLAGASTAVCGPISFLGLVVPHVGRLLCGPDYRLLVPVSALLGGFLLLGADVVGRVLIPGQEVQVGLMMAVLGAPVLIGLIRRKRLAAL